MADHKPLPTAPIPTSLTNLSIEARNHRSKLVRHLLSEVYDPGGENRHDDWLIALEEALDELSRCIRRGDWLSGIKRDRMSRTRRQPNHPKRENTQQSNNLVETRGDKDASAGKLSGRQDKNSYQDDPSPSPDRTLDQLRALRQRASPPSTALLANHLLICAASFGSDTPPLHDHNLEITPTKPGCIFIPGTFSLPEDSSINADENVLYGLREWNASVAHLDPQPAIRLVGGTFFFIRTSSPLQHHLLCKVLRISVYIHLSLILEQHFLLDSNIHLKFPRPRLSLPSPSAPNKQSTPPQQIPESTGATKNINSLIPSKLFSFFSKKAFRHRSRTIEPVFGRRSYDSVSTSSPDNIPLYDQSPRSSTDGSDSVLRRFSFIGERRERRLSIKKVTQQTEDIQKPFTATLKRIENSSGVLSTSVGVNFHPPSLIVKLAEQEKTQPNVRLNGDDRVGLSSLLGWDGSETQGKGMSGILGFSRQQEISVLFSQHTPPTSNTSASEISSPIALSPSASNSQPTMQYALCGRPKWLTYRYYSFSLEDDKTLGEEVLRLIDAANKPCETIGCQFKQKLHEYRLIHGGFRILVNVEANGDEITSRNDIALEMWESCVVCSKKSTPTKMNDGTFLFSYGKFLENLIYSPSLCNMTPTLCEHTTPPPGPWHDLPASRLNIKRHFSISTATVTFSLSTVEEIFEFRVPRLQINRGSHKISQSLSNSETVQQMLDKDKDERCILRREIKRWWEGVSDHMDKLEYLLAGGSRRAENKTLPRLPSEDGAYAESDASKTPQQSSIHSFPTPRVPFSEFTGSSSENKSSTDEENLSTPTSSTVMSKPEDESEQLLINLRLTFQRTEQSLYAQLAKTPLGSLNDVRRSFLSAAKGTNRRLAAWQTKHLAAKVHLMEELSTEEPEWWGKGCHAVPGSSIIVREDDWGSIIAFTLSNVDYQRELTNLSGPRPSPTAPVQTQPSTPTALPSSFLFAAGYKLFSSSHKQPDPDQDDVIWHEPETYSAVISRKQHTRDPTSFLSIREVLRQRTPNEASTGIPPPRTGGGASNSNTLPPPAAWSKPDVSISKEAAGGEVSGLPETAEGNVEKLLHGIGIISSDHHRPPSVRSDTFSTSSSGIIDAHIRSGNASSIISLDSSHTIGKDNSSAMYHPIPPPRDSKANDNVTHHLGATDISQDTHLHIHAPEPQASVPSSSSAFATTLATGWNTAMRFVTSNTSSPQTSSPVPKNHHGLLLANIDERPHIKYDWTVGKRLKFSCTVYYAKQFDNLRRRCGVDGIFLKSLSRSSNWVAEGGKSKSNFWKTSDERFIIKTLVNAWNVADLQVLIELAPSYFRYVESTASRATVLAKLVGFYTIEIRNLETGNVQSKADLLVMENLFYDQKITKTFDLKGIQGRKVKPGNLTSAVHHSRTLFDGEWIEGQQRALMLVRPYSKAILQEAIKSDADFLSKSNIMDYSLLLGVDEERKQIACGLVDTIGSYTFAKTLEYKAKQGLQSGKEVTVIPPAEYQERFVKALEGYFLACPDKWSKPLDESKIINDPNLLPSVL